MKKLIVFIFTLFLIGCTMKDAIYTSNIISLTSQAIANQNTVEKYIREYAFLFNDEEKYFLAETSIKIASFRQRIIKEYNASSAESAKDLNVFLADYRTVKRYYKTAIKIVEKKLPEMPVLTAMEIENQIEIVRALDSNVEALLSQDKDGINKKEVVTALVNILSVVAKITMAATFKTI